MPGYFYIMTNKHNTVLYCGATDDLSKRISEHKNNVYTNSFTSRYNIHKLVYYESFSVVEHAFAREKQLKAGSRRKKIDLIELVNPGWEDLFEKMSYGSLEELNRIRKCSRP